MTLTLTPKSGDSRLETIVIEKFPFLVSKTGATFSRYRSHSGHGPELEYLSRRHAYIHQKGGQACIEDLGSSNGTFLDGLRLRQHAVPLQDRAVFAFGGKHFVYEVSITRRCAVEPAESGGRKPPTERKPGAPQASVSVSPQPAVEPAESGGRKPPTERKPDPPLASVSVSPQPAVVPPESGACKPPAERKPEVPQASDRTQFVVAPTSFLHVFCDSDGPKENEVPPDGSAVPAAPAKEP